MDFIYECDALVIEKELEELNITDALNYITCACEFRKKKEIAGKNKIEVKVKSIKIEDINVQRLVGDFEMLSIVKKKEKGKKKRKKGKRKKEEKKGKKQREKKRKREEAEEKKRRKKKEEKRREKEEENNLKNEASIKFVVL
ncbi:9458_t:CDS:2 [Gigaspora margarita]|uniref:9458_t:CDS:1 n=1 Tax=Gigaspora margarita TaxID=4874 RepID=A0ABN7VHQ8_GIGMA|nr:9458_t:CDS:2 [Gigaspora margarita]